MSLFESRDCRKCALETYDLRQEIENLKEENEKLRWRITHVKFTHLAKDAMELLKISKKERKTGFSHMANLFQIGQNLGLSNCEVEAILTCANLVYRVDEES